MESGSNSFARRAALLCGKPITFLIAIAVVIIWALTGPLFQFSDTWQLVINTGTTIVTFLMVFLIQNTQNRDTMAVQIKLAELIIALKGAQNQLAIAEDLSEHELERLHEKYKMKAQATSEELSTLRKKRSPSLQALPGPAKALDHRLSRLCRASLPGRQPLAAPERDNHQPKRRATFAAVGAAHPHRVD